MTPRGLPDHDAEFRTGTRAEVITRWEREGRLDPACDGCREFYAAAHPQDVFAPSHKASRRCEAGGRYLGPVRPPSGRSVAVRDLSLDLSMTPGPRR